VNVLAPVEKLTCKIFFVNIFGPDHAFRLIFSFDVIAILTLYLTTYFYANKSSFGMSYLVFDIETKNAFRDIARPDPVLLDLSLVGIYDSSDDTYEAYLEEDLHRLWPRIERADAIIGYNSDHFDIPILNKYYHGDLFGVKSIDLMASIVESLQRRVRLDAVAEATLGKKKSGNGLDAITWWKQGEIEKIKRYCLDDVKITKELYDYALAHQSLKCAVDGKVVDIPINTVPWLSRSPAALTYSLPF
jgi:DNA polymerase elongation subunit (family B)